MLRFLQLKDLDKKDSEIIRRRFSPLVFFQLRCGDHLPVYKVAFNHEKILTEVDGQDL